MAENLRGQRVAVLATDGFEQLELTEPVKALRQSGARVDIVSPHSGEIQGMQHKEKGDKVRVDRTLDEAKAEDYAALVLPGGVGNPTNCVWTRARYGLFAISPTPKNRLPRSAMDLGRFDHGLVTSRKPDDLPAFCANLTRRVWRERRGARRPRWR